MKPLEAPGFDAIAASASKAERFWGRIPLLGVAIADRMWGERTWPIVQSVEKQLRSRPKPEDSTWGMDAAKWELARFVCTIAMMEMDWPNDHFIPDDPAKIVLWSHDDGLGVEGAVMRIEKHLGITLEAAEVNGWFSQTLGQVIDALWERQAPPPQEGVWPPAPRKVRADQEGQ